MKPALLRASGAGARPAHALADRVAEEGSDIAGHLVDAVTAAGVTVVFVTHLHELAQRRYDQRDRFPGLFRRAEPDRSFRVHEAAPESTAHGTDLWYRMRRSSSTPDTGGAACRRSRAGIAGRRPLAAVLERHFGWSMGAGQQNGGTPHH
ncbi:hypothetical protein GCM10010172_03370 [Paractinoplanes ferrugineus]|uniref:DNA mismatch repair proteins mutS family domain-containing protein n=1 Tax=Paractinoplanes ferrugineus TaxID=113564 RepID=A0A919MMY5_9ACTN|nr:hypothetical protein [Actinoplanes ferrugineus]GIE13742.1 hypothetical protein Afe05nite_55820 [Actinoplanes ferrugineus]